MSIRKKMMLAFVAASVIPLVLAGSFYWFSLFVTARKVSQNLNRVVEQFAQNSMARILEEFEDDLRLQSSLLESLVEIQKSGFEHATVSPSPALSPGPISPIPGEIAHQIFFRFTPSGDSIRLKVDWTRQSIFSVNSQQMGMNSRDVVRLQQMTPLYARLRRRLPKGILWQYTALESGVMGVYPAGNEIPVNYDPRTRLWYRQAQESGRLQWSAPYVDAFTRQLLITVSAPLINPQGEFIGVTAVDVRILDILRLVKVLPKDWSEDAHAFLIDAQGAEETDRLPVYVQLDYSTTHRNWRIPVERKYLTSVDQQSFREMVQDIRAGKGGIRRMEYRGKSALWVYRGFSEKRIYPILIVPYRNLEALVKQTRYEILNRNVRWLYYSLIFSLIVGLVAVLGATRFSRRIVSPIRELTEKSRLLAEGDFLVRADVHTADELEELAGVFNRIGPYLKEREEMKTSLEAARLIQQRLLPEVDFRKNGFHVAGMCAYSDETGGDFYDFLWLQDGETEQIVVLLGDVSGHGIAAALLMAMARALMRNNLRQFNGDLSRALAATNAQLVADTEPQKFVTLFALKWQPATGKLFWATAGHDPALWWQYDSGKIEQLEGEGIPLGFLSGVAFSETGPKQLKQGDVVVIGTDGIWEAENEKGEMFGKERLQELIRTYHTATARELAERIVQEVKNYCGNRKLQDDVTVVVVKMEGPKIVQGTKHRNGH